MKRVTRSAVKPGAKPARRSADPRRPLETRRHKPKRDEDAERSRKAGRWVLGLHACAEVINVRPRAISELWLRTDWERSEDLTAIAERTRKYGITPKARAPGHFDAIGHGHQGVAMLVSENPELDWLSLETDEPCVVLVLDGLEDPHNLGSILRTAWLTAVKAIIIPEDRAVGLTPAVCKIASGGAEHVPIIRASNFALPLERLKTLGFWIYGLAEAGERKPWEFQLPRKTIWVVGSESSGIRSTTARLCDELVRLPQVPGGSSFNASIALSMALTETMRQLGSPA